MTGRGDVPDIFHEDIGHNPCIYSPNAPYAIYMYQTRETLFCDADIFKRFIESAIKTFRGSATYTKYKGYLARIGMDRCQILGNITMEMVGSKGIEMHHNGITIFDIAMIVTNHILNERGKVSTFNVVKVLKDIHKKNMVPLVMICKSMHQMYHNDDEFFLPASMTFGNWTKLLEDYCDGITFGIAKKLKYWIEDSMKHINDPNLNKDLILLSEKIEGWAYYNECGYNSNNQKILNQGMINN